MAADPTKPGIAKLLRDLALDLTPVIGEIRSGMQAAKDFKAGNYGMGALGALGAIPLLGMAGRGARGGLKFISGSDIVARAIKEQKIAEELQRTAALVSKAEPDVKLTGRALNRGEKVVVTSGGGRRRAELAVLPREELPGTVSVRAFVEKAVQTGHMTPEAAENALRHNARSKAKDVLYRGDIMDPNEPIYDVLSKTNDLGFHIGTAGQAGTIKERTNGDVWDAIMRAKHELGLNGLTAGEFAKTPEGQAIIAKMGPLTSPQVGHRVMPVMLDARRPMLLNDHGVWNPADVLDEIADRHYPSKHGVDEYTWEAARDDVLRAGEEGFSDDSRAAFWDLLDRLGTGALANPRARLSDATPGYDAIQYLNVAEDLPLWQPQGTATSGWSYLFPESSQMKSLRLNSGEFSRFNPNIFRAAVGTAGAGLLGSAMLKDRENDGN